MDQDINDGKFVVRESVFTLFTTGFLALCDSVSGFIDLYACTVRV